MSSSALAPMWTSPYQRECWTNPVGPPYQSILRVVSSNDPTKTTLVWSPISSMVMEPKTRDPPPVVPAGAHTGLWCNASACPYNLEQSSHCLPPSLYSVPCACMGFKFSLFVYNKILTYPYCYGCIFPIRYSTYFYSYVERHVSFPPKVNKMQAGLSRCMSKPSDQRLLLFGTWLGMIRITWG